MSKTTEETREAWRVERQIRARIAEEIAAALDERGAEWATPSKVDEIPEGWDSHHLIVRGATKLAYQNAAKLAREIGGSR